MNILFDQTQAQAFFYNGAAEYAQTLFLNMVRELPKHEDVRIFCLYNADRKFRYEMLAPEAFADEKRVEYVNHKGKSLKEIVAEKKIDLLFTPCLQSFCDLPLGNLKNLGCKAVCVIHDFTDEEMKTSGMYIFRMMRYPLKLIRYYLSRTKVRLMSGNLKKREQLTEDILLNNDADVVTVSNYSRNSFEYNYPRLQNKIHVFYSPHKQVGEVKAVENPQLRAMIESGKKFFLLLSADRLLKNADHMINAFRRFSESQKEYNLITIGFGKNVCERHTDLPFLSSSDLEQAYKHCHALLYPSLFEGFGYPPLEAMKHGKPVLSSFACSMPEVLQDAPIYFSPIYETDMYKALTTFATTPYEELAERARKQYEKVHARQEADLQTLTEKILTNNF